MDQPVHVPGKNKKTVHPDRIIDSWKEIAQFLHRDVRTVMRWEKTRSLPVRRMPGGKKSGVYALQSELEAWRNEGPDNPRPDRGRTIASTDSPSIAVLPFLNLSHEKGNEFFSDGLADEIVTLLTRIPELKVTARTSSFAFRGWNGDIREIGEKLGVTSILEGSVQLSGGMIRVSVQLINASDGFHLWGEVYNRKTEDIFAVQDDISAAVARALSIRLVPNGMPVVRRTGNMEAYREWIRGRYYLQNMRSVNDVVNSRECFSRVVQIDPDYAAGYLGLAEYYLYAVKLGLLPPGDALCEGKTQALCALEKDEDCADAHTILAVFRGIVEYDWEAAGRGFKRALEIDPASPRINSEYAMQLLAPLGQLQEAETRITRALELDPMSPERHCQMSQIHMYQRRFSDAEADARTAQSIGDFPFAHWQLGLIHALQGRLDEAMAVCRDTFRRSHGNMPMAWAAMGIFYAWAGQTRKTMEMLDRIETEINAGRMSPLGSALIHIALGNRDQAFNCLNQAIDQRDPHVIHLPVMPIYDGLRGDPRFHALLARMRLREYSGKI